MKRRDLQRVLFIARMPVATFSLVAEPTRNLPLFEFHSNFWMNLHHTLFREAARLDSKAQLAPLDTTGLIKQEKLAWDRAVAYYRHAFAGKRLLFDEGPIHINELLATAPDDGGTALPSGLERELREELASVADLYRRHCWSEHDQANRAWVATMQPRIASTGTTIASELERLLKAPWPAGPHRIEVAYYVAERDTWSEASSCGRAWLASPASQALTLSPNAFAVSLACF